MSETKVHGCIDCPMYDDGANYEYEQICNHPLAPHQYYEPGEDNPDEIPRIEVTDNGEDFFSGKYKEVPITPEWCPLKKEPITIIYE